VSEVRSYHGRPVLKAPVWTWEIPWYFFAGGLAGASAVLAAAARLAGNEPLARAARRAGLAGTAVSPFLLISDLGRPERFHHMLRVFKPTSPMSVGTWVLTGFGPSAAGSAVLAELGWFPRLQRTAEVTAGALGPVMATYTAVLFADTAVPVWHEARHELPLLFAASAAASAGAAAAVMTPPAAAGPARRLAVTAAAVELATGAVMERRLGGLAAPYEDGRAGRLARLARALTAAGAALLALGGRRRPLAMLGGALVLAGSACLRWSVFRAGQASAADPAATIGPQRARMGDD
jgi:formate-dependent nitrite reductase membrane component NrfD